MQENKYFVPSIEDIRVGYEFEQYIPGSEKKDGIKKYNKRKVGDLHSIIGTAYNAGLQDWIRVPYLTKEQIEPEGWKEIPRELNGFGRYSYFQKGDKYITFQEKEHLIEIHNDEAYADHQTWYEGECKDINTFRTICKLLGI